MESREGIVDSIKDWLKHKKALIKSTPESPQPIPGWDYETYREYLLALSRGREFLLPIEEYPQRIELSQPWHEAFNGIRANPKEGWFLVGYEEGQRRLVLPRIAENGLSHSVPARAMMAGLEKARVKAGITDMVGDVHSHPRPLTDVRWHIPTGVTSDGAGAFSLGDLYGLLYYLNEQRPADPKRSLMFVAEGNENIAAFATRGSLKMVKNDFSGSYENFASQWYGRYGWRFVERGPEAVGGGEYAVPIRSDAPKIWQINKGVAHHYQLALYRGFTDRPLLREYPGRNGS
jgi:hypothetical protein